MKLLCQLFGVAILMILSASAAFIGVINFAVNGSPLLALGTGLVGAVVVALFIRALIALNNSWSAGYSKRFAQDDNVLARWSVARSDWEALAEYEQEESKRDAPMMGAILGGIFALITVVGVFPISPAVAVVSALVLGLFFAGLGYWVERRAAMKPYYRSIDNFENDIKLREDGILIRGTLVAWGGFSGSLEAFECGEIEGLDFPVLTLEICKMAGDTYVNHTYRVPLPRGVNSLDKLADNHKARLALATKLESLAA